MARTDVSADRAERWRAMRAKRRARENASGRRRKPLPVRPGGHTAPCPPPAAEPIRATTPSAIPKAVPRNPHRPGSIAWALLYDYRSAR